MSLNKFTSPQVFDNAPCSEDYGSSNMSHSSDELAASRPINIWHSSSDPGPLEANFNKYLTFADIKPSSFPTSESITLGSKTLGFKHQKPPDSTLESSTSSEYSESGNEESTTDYDLPGDTLLCEVSKDVLRKQVRALCSTQKKYGITFQMNPEGKHHSHLGKRARKNLSLNKRVLTYDGVANVVRYVYFHDVIGKYYSPKAIAIKVSNMNLPYLFNLMDANNMNYDVDTNAALNLWLSERKEARILNMSIKQLNFAQLIEEAGHKYVTKALEVAVIGGVCFAVGFVIGRNTKQSDKLTKTLHKILEKSLMFVSDDKIGPLLVALAVLTFVAVRFDVGKMLVWPLAFTVCSYFAAKGFENFSIIHKMSIFGERAEEPAETKEDSSESMFTILMSILSFITGVYIFGKGMSFSASEDSLKKTVKNVALANSLYTLGQNSRSLSDWLVKFISNLIIEFGYYYFPKSMLKTHLSPKKTLGAYNALRYKDSKLVTNLDLIEDPELCNEFVESYSSLQQIKDKAAEHGIKNDVINAIKSILREDESLYVTAKSMAPDSDSMITPFCLYIYGAPGLGKSSLSSILAKKIFPTGKMFVRDVNDPFWSGYNAAYHKTIVFDDFMQFKDLAKNDGRDFMSIMTNVPKPLNMPSVDNAVLGLKGTKFKSPLVIVCSNVAEPDIPAQADPDAFRRRRHLYVAVEPAEDLPPDKDGLEHNISEFMDGRILDLAALSHSYDDPYEAALQFTIQHTMTGKPQKSGLRFTDLVKVFEERFVKHIENEQRRINYSERSRDGNNVLNLVCSICGKSLEIRSMINGNVPCRTSMQYVCPDCGSDGTVKSCDYLLNLSIGVAMAGAGLILIWKIISPYLMGKQDCSSTPEDGGETGVPRYRAPGPKGPGSKLKRKALGIEETSFDVESQLYASIEKARVFVIVENFIGKKSCFGFMVKGRMVLTPYHIFNTSTYTNSVHSITVHVYNMYGEEKYHAINFSRTDRDIAKVYHEGNALDLVAFTLPERCPNYAKLTHRLPKESEIAFFKSYNDNVMYDIGEGLVQDRAYYYSNLSMGPSGHSHVNYFQVAGRATKGSCGSILIDSKKGTILGMLIGVVRNSTHFEVITEEVVHALEKQLDEIIVDQEPPECLPINKKQMPGQLKDLGYQNIYVPSLTSTIMRTKFRADKNLLQFFPRNKHMDVGILHARDPRFVAADAYDSPLKRAISDFGTPVTGFPNVKMDPDMLHKAILHVKKKHTVERIGRVLTVNEAINGVKEEELNFEKISMKTSCGLPYVDRGMTKRDVLKDVGTTEPYHVPLPFLHERIEARLKGLKTKRIVPSLWKDFLKDELRPLEKIKKGKTRVISVPPLDFMICVRMYFGDFCNMIQRRRIYNSVCIGINAESEEWNRLANWLLSHSDSFVAADYSKFDKRLPSDIMFAFLKVVEDYYVGTKEDKICRRLLMEEIIYTYSRCQTNVYQKFRGNPSGNPLTAVMNSICNDIIITYACIKINNLDVRTITYGDDFVMAIKDKFPIKDFANEITKMGMVITNFDKDGECRRLTIDEIGFLKRKFGRNNYFTQGFVPQIESDTILKIMEWSRYPEKKDSRVDTTRFNCALIFAAFHSTEHYKKLYTAILHHYGKPLKLFTLPDIKVLFSKGALYHYLHENQEGHSAMSGVKMFKAVEVYEEMADERHDSSAVPINSKSQSIRSDIQHIALHDSEGPPDSHSNTAVQPMRTRESGNMALGVRYAQKKNITSNKPGIKLSDPLRNYMLNDIPWSLTKAVEKPAYLKSVEWAATHTTGHLLDKLNIPGDVLGDDLAEMPFRHFTYCRFDTVLRFSVNASPFHQGIVVACFQPLIKDSYWIKRYKGLRSYTTTVPHVFLNASKSNVCELRIPFRSVVDYLSLTKGVQAESVDTFVGRVSLVVYNPLKADSASAQNVRISVVARLENAEFKVPRPSSANPKFLVEETGNSVSHVYNVTGENNHIDVEDELVNKNKTEVSTNLSAQPFGMHAPNNTSLPIQVHVRDTNLMCNSRNLFSMERMTLNADSLNPNTIEDVSTDEDEMELGWLLSKPSLLGSVTMLGTHTTGHILAWGNLSPMSITDKAGDITPLEYFKTMCCFWCGNLHYTIKCAPSAFQKGQIFFGVHYGVYTKPTKLTSQYGVYINIEQENDTVIEVPYRANTPALSCEAASQKEMSMGVWSLSVVNKLIVPIGAVQNIDINILVSGDKDFKFHQLKGYAATDVLDNTTTVQTYEDDAPSTSSSFMVYEETADDIEAENEEITIGPVSVFPWKVFGEQITSLQEILRRFYPYSRAQTSAGDFEIEISNLVAGARFEPRGLNNTAADHKRFTPTAALASIYTMWRGSVRICLTGRHFLYYNIEVRGTPPNNTMDIDFPYEPVTRISFNPLGNRTTPLADSFKQPRFPSTLMRGKTFHKMIEIPYSAITKTSLIQKYGAQEYTVTSTNKYVGPNVTPLTITGYDAAGGTLNVITQAHSTRQVLAKWDVEVDYAMANDFRYSGFCGFGYMKFQTWGCVEADNAGVGMST